jgi:hypothetical protein
LVFQPGLFYASDVGLLTAIFSGIGFFFGQFDAKNQHDQQQHTQDDHGKNFWVKKCLSANRLRPSSSDGEDLHSWKYRLTLT